MDTKPGSIYHPTWPTPLDKKGKRKDPLGVGGVGVI